MSIQNLNDRDPFADNLEADFATRTAQTYVHIRIQQRNGRKSLTTVSGLSQEIDFKKVLKALKKAYCCNGTVVEDEQKHKVLQMQGDQRDPVKKFLIEEGLAKEESVKVHGF